MTDERYKALMEQVGMPNSRSLLGALQQVANEVEQEVRAALAQPPAPTAPPCNRDRNSYCQCERKAMMCDGVGPAPTAQPVQQPGAEPDMRHPKIQALIGSKARCQIELMLVEQLIEDPDCDLTSMDMEYWGPMHDRLKEALTKAAPAQRQPLTAEAVFASKDFMSMNGLYWGLGIETLMQIVRVTERECAAAWGVTLAQKGEKL